MAKILAVDDSLAIRKMVSFVLSQDGHQVTLAENGSEALDLSIYLCPDLILTDINMPLMSGFELAVSLKKVQHCKHIPIIALTTESFPELKQKGKESGINGWMIKPLQPDKLRTLVRNLTS